MRKLTKALTVVSLLAPVSGHSLGIGDIRVRSALNQNLNAEISLVASRGEDPSNIKVSLAPAEKFDEAGVPWTYFLSKIRFQPIVKPNGSIVIKVTSKEALKEPYLNFLLEVSWPKGNLYREFTVLVDPPADYQSKSYLEPASQFEEPTYSSSPSYDSYRAPRPEHTLRQRPVKNRVAKTRRASNGNYGGQIVTRRNDTLWNVADRTRDAGVTVEQMMVALYEKNPHAFYQQNVNALSAGKRLQIPGKEVVQKLSQDAALAEFTRQNDAWNNNRSGVPAREPQVAKEEVVDSQLKLEAPIEATVGASETVSPAGEQSIGSTSDTSAQPAPSNPEVPPLQKQTEKATTPADDALQGKIAALEKQMAMMQELIALKDKQLADLQNPIKTEPLSKPPTAEATPPTSITGSRQPEQVPPPPSVTPTAPEQLAPTSVKPVQPVTPPPKPIVKPTIKKLEKPVPTTEEPSFPIAWIAGGLGGILLPLLGWFWWQKKKLGQESETASIFRDYNSVRGGETTGTFSSGRKSGPVSSMATADSSFLNDFKASDFESFESFNVDHGDIDPLAEADVYLAYGRYQQAEELIRQAIQDHPDRDDCKLKLLEIFHASSNKADFENYAKELAAKGKQENKDFWRKVAELGRDINPDSALYNSVATNNVAVFSSESEVLAENVLLSPVGEDDQAVEHKDEPEEFGTATFEISDVDEGESVFDTPSHEPIAQQPVETPTETKLENTKSDIDASVYGNEQGDDEKVSEFQNNDSLDFDLGLATGLKDKTPDTSDRETIEIAPSQKLDDASKTENEEFDFNFDFIKPESAETEPVVKIESKVESIDADRTLEFSFNKPDVSENDTLNFDFDLDFPQSPSAQKKPDSSFGVSDLTDMDEVETKLDLAKAYIDMGDINAAKEILDQVLENGSADQKQTARSLMEELG